MKSRLLSFVRILAAASAVSASAQETSSSEEAHRDEAEVVRGYEKAAAAGDAAARTKLGITYAKGQGVPQNDSEAVRWFKRGAEAGNSLAQYNLGVFYANGRGVRRDEVEAVRWLRKAAGAGRADAQLSLGACYLGGHGVSKDPAEGIKWIRKAADAGNPSAEFTLGQLYAEGRAIRKDSLTASLWYDKAVADGCDLIPIQSLSKRVSTNSFVWCVFVDPSYAKMAEIASVQYTLHPTFPHPVRKISNPAHHFVLAGSAWGNFNIGVVVTLKNGETKRENFYLHLTEDALLKYMASQLARPRDQLRPPQAQSHALAESMFLSGN